MTPEVLGTGGDTAFLMVPLPSPKEGLQHSPLNTDLRLPEHLRPQSGTRKLL